MGRKSPPVNEKAVEAKEKKALDKFVKEQRAKKQEEVRRTSDTWRRSTTDNVPWKDQSKYESGGLTWRHRMWWTGTGCDVEGSRGREEEQGTGQAGSNGSRGEHRATTRVEKTTREDGIHALVLTTLTSPLWMQRQEAKMKKQEAKKAAREEEDALVNKQKGKAAKVTLADINKGKQEEIHKHKQLVEQKKRENRRVVTEDEYAGVVEQPNANREVDSFSAHGLDQAVDAVSKLSVGDGSSTPDRNAEKRMKALYFAYQERELPKIRAEKPGLKLSQYKDRIWQAWQKSPENPMKGL
eukprot:scaffold587_cov339-Pavlova_lutheri.AAC.67